MTPAVYVAIAAATIALASFGFAIFQFRHGKAKVLTWSVLSNTALVPEAGRGEWADLQVNWRKNSVDEPRLIVVRLTNSGKVELKKDDNDEPPRLDVTPAKILAVEVTFLNQGGKRAQKVEPDEVTESTVKLKAQVINPGDALTFTLLVDGQASEIDLAVRAAGFRARSITIADSDARRSRMWAAVATATGLLGLLVAVFAFVAG
ncbi:hypothetical protein [Actinoplanes aureus]|uniref:Uncharacterized protein n=1 Tax=Actinoplanes aureus TaxID=2792083 RepID=A0A931BYY8_9ACTN|nr:hypothetical protein [Actinoplanes aureus]MBG0560124.1 hypothetical protein [Actinoplanes aureus]